MVQLFSSTESNPENLKRMGWSTSSVHFAGIHRLYVLRKTINRLYFLKKQGYCRCFTESRCGQITAIGNEVIREAMRRNRTTTLSKLSKTFPCLFFVSVFFYFVFCYKSFASTDLVKNQMRIHIAMEIRNTKSNRYFLQR